MGGLTAQQVRDKWQREGDAACRKETIDLTLEDQVIGTVNLTELGVSVTPQEAAQAAWNAAHGGNFFVNGYHLIRSWFGTPRRRSSGTWTPGSCPSGQKASAGS